MITDNEDHMEQDHTITDPLDHYLPYDLNTLKALNTDNGESRRVYSYALYCQLGQNPELLCCAYCEFSFEDHIHWKFLSLDHVVPRNAAERLGISKDLWDSGINLVFCCRACNDYNQYSPKNPFKALPYIPEPGVSPKAFLRLRKDTFPHRLRHIIDSTRADQQCFNTLWAGNSVNDSEQG
ncbi:hypothetical protein KSC_028850 [Ktedonobacter sp. SOSP1-52]|uniref:HNH endonuclease n=1 Tax=Ktedonobacter sp. SOSP1-52 TaxID=2778366 RepID=UPI00191685A6|nr:HNH endonuclease [Ktedonobacter sp. SOSP1-52]GHO63993.1 hypothetical protein KSC_028850 [Ktedonobacter sp. SOSP1-52]